MLAAVMVLSILAVPTDVQAASKKKAVTKLSVATKSINLVEGKSKNVKVTVKVTNKASKKFTVKSSSSKVATAKVSGSNVKITAKKAGKATITVTTKAKNKKNKKLTAKINVTVTPKKAASGNGSSDSSSSGNSSSNNNSTGNGSSSSGSSRSGSDDSIHISTPTINPVVDNGFNWASDVTYVDTAKMGKVSFTINEETTSAEELEAQGYTISADRKTAEKDTWLEVRTYTVKKIPNTLRGIQTIPLKGEYNPTTTGYTFEAKDKTNGIGFNTMAATVLAAASFKGYNNPGDPHGDKDPQIQELRKIFEYLNGPRAADNIANVRWQTAVDSLKASTDEKPNVPTTIGKNNVYLSYLGADYKNQYKDPGAPYTFSVYRGPYYIPEKSTINGKRPETYMIFVGEGKMNEAEGEENAWGTDRYIDVWKSSDGNWYSYQDNFLHVLANEFRGSEEGF